MAIFRSNVTLNEVITNHDLTHNQLWSDSLLLITKIFIIILIFYLHLIPYSLLNITKTTRVSGSSTGQNPFQLKNNTIIEQRITCKHASLPWNAAVWARVQLALSRASRSYEQDIGDESLIGHALRDFAPFVQFKNVWNTHGGVLL